jgi:hydrogenase-4 component E
VSAAGSLLLVAILLSNFRLLGGSRLVALIRTAAFQGILLGILALLLQRHGPAPSLLLLAAGGIAIKGLVLPQLLQRAIRQVEIRREVEPLVGYNVSLLLGAVALGAASAAARGLPLPHPTTSPLLVPTSFFTVAVGLFLIAARRKALTQVLGYLVFENGIYAFGLAIASEQPLLVELGVLLDLLVGVFVMGVIVFHIQRDFEHIDVDRLAALRDARRQARRGKEAA